MHQALRSLVRGRGITLIALLTLSLGIAANTAIFSLVDALVLRPLSYRDAERIVHVSEKDAQGRAINFSWPDWVDVHARSRTLASQALYKSDTFVLSCDADEPRQIAAGLVTRSFFEVLGAEPPLGRGFSVEEDHHGGPPVVVLSHRLWREAYGADPTLIGKTVSLDTRPYTVVGVAPPQLDLPSGVEAWVSLGRILDGGDQRGGHSAGRMVARLAPGATLAQARAELDAIGRAIEAEHHAGLQITGAVVRPLHDVLAGQVRLALLLLLGAVGLVLLIACANVANLLLVRATARRRELAVRAALGASRAQLIRLLLGESLILAAAGGGLGVLLASWGTDVLVALGRASLPRVHPVEISTRVLAFAVALSAVTSLIFGLLPALRATRVDPAEGLKGTLPGAGRLFSGSRKMLVTVEMALAVLLLVDAGLLIESFRQVSRIDPGFAAANVFTVRTSLPGAKYTDREAVARFAAELEPRLAAIPGVTAVALADIPPLSDRMNQMGLEIDGEPGRSDDPSIDTSAVSPGYFATLGIALRAGRAFAALEPGPVAVVDELLARRLGPDPIGRRLRWRRPGSPWITVVGVVGSVKAFGLDAATRPQLYAPLAQYPSWDLTLLVRSTLPPAALTVATTAAVRDLDPGQPVSAAAMMSDVVDPSNAARRFNTVVLGVFAALALLLATVGVYCVVAYLAAQRTREIAIRMALGARARDIARLVVGEGMGPFLVGVVLGGAGAAASARGLSSLLYGVSPFEPVAYAGAAIFLAVVAVIASLLPARRAARIEPMVALRRE